jgi:hypothetical protein
MNAIAAHIYSTLTSSNEYVKWKRNSVNDLPQKEFSVIIQGGAGLAPKRAGLVTRYGIRTDVDAVQLDFLMNDNLFQNHVDGGWLTIVPASGMLMGAPAPEAVIGDMAHRDGSAQFVPADYAPGKAPVAGHAVEAEITSRPRQVPLRSGMFR